MTRFAETWTDIGRLPLRRRDVNAMRLALDCCKDARAERSRASGAAPSRNAAAIAETLLRAENALLTGGDVARDVARDFHDAWNAMRTSRTRRARLALLLRVLLRVNAGDYADDREPRYFRDCRDRFADGWATDHFGNWIRPRRVAPLWEQA